MSTRTLDKYIAWLKKEELVHVEDKNLIMQPYRVLRKYDINITEREENTILYDTDKEATLAEIIISVAMVRFKERWSRMYWKKLKQNQDKYNTLYNLLLEHGAEASSLNNPEYFRTMHLELMLQAYNEEKPGHSFTLQLLHEDIVANPDLNARASTYAFKLGYGSAMSFCHLKFRLVKKGLISVRKDHVEGMQRARKDEKIFHHRWLKEFKHTIWFRCDQITINAGQFLGEKISKKAAA